MLVEGLSLNDLFFYNAILFSQVYSTCSLSEEQNEGVVKWLTSVQPTAKIVPVQFSVSQSMVRTPTASSKMVCEGSIAGTVRFLPNLTRSPDRTDHSQLYGGGFFLAKIRKTTELADKAE
jgi:16S rRNA C967 or C1407 C5-methylase (RsmB/RsmF family)